MVAAEQSASEADIKYLSTVVTDDLLFGRADGSVVDKTTFLRDVPKSARRLTERRAFNIEPHVLGASALVTLTVVGVDESGQVQAFRNIRFFVERNNRWLLQHWYNMSEAVPPGAGPREAK
jgi:hypothetical protein